jgi:hypothetical protein
VADDQVVAQCCHFTGRSAEGFLRGVDLGDLQLNRGDLVESELFLRCT